MQSYYNQDIKQQVQMKSFRILLQTVNERFSCRFYFLFIHVQAFLCCCCHFSIQLFCFSLFDEHSKFFKLCAQDPQHNFFCGMYFLLITYYWANHVINLPNVVSISQLYLFVYLFILFNRFLFFFRSMAAKTYEAGYSKYYGDRLKNVSKSISEEEIKQLYRDWASSYDEVRKTFKLIYFVAVV